MIHGLRIIVLLLASVGLICGATPPVTYLDDAGTRFITLETRDDGKVLVSLRTVYAPGGYGRWIGAGEQGAKGIEFSQKVNEGEPPAPAFLATGGQGSLTVKLKPGQPGVQDTALSGIYHHVSDDKIAFLAKKDGLAAVQRLDDAIKMAQRKSSGEDRPGYTEWKKAWPELRDRLVTLSVSKPGAPVSLATVSKTASGLGTALPPETLAAFWVLRAEFTGLGVNFVSGGVPPGVKSNWEGIFDDGFGGSIQIFVVSNGDARFTISSSRGPDGAGGAVEGKMPTKTLRKADDGSFTGEFVDNNPQLKEGEMQTRMHFRRIGHFIVVESQYAERYTGRGWFDGIYVMRPPPPEAGSQ